MLGAAFLLGLALAGCGGARPVFDPAGPCVADGRAAGAYPDLEAELPTILGGEAPTTVDSGRNCSTGALGSLVAHDLDEIRFAGATWDLGGGRGVSSVVFAIDGADLPGAWIAEFYEIGARTAKRTDNIAVSRPAFPGAGEAWRLDTLNDLSLQSVVTWQDGRVVRVVLVATPAAPGASREAHDELVEAAVAATVGAASGSGVEAVVGVGVGVGVGAGASRVAPARA
ncbi:MAG TPA: hypothetical protein VLS28_08265 [Candidatus Sulfomarinibacteraceae bacterium]|nr:hypothetical protein [Candidatus Sulfomarinibacteraceae bacterium]